MNRPATLLPLGLALAIVAAAAESSAQTVQLAPFAGYGFGGSVQSADDGQSYSIKSGLVYGGTADFRISPGWRFEVLYSRQETKLESSGLVPSLDLNVERYLAGFQEEKGADGPTRVFGTVLFGATRFVPALPGASGTTRFTAGLALGVKSFFSKNVGLRLEARGFFTSVKGSAGLACVDGSCLFAFSGSGLWQGDLGGGLILAF
jgi:hypothetical protein